jgi:undecaprenyl-diphosphatase
LLGNVYIVLWSLLVGGIILVIFERARRGKETPAPADLSLVTYKQALIIGLFQSIAIIPGVSRSAATIVGGLSLGLSRATIIEFSFLLAIPTMAAATGLDLLKSGHSFSHSEIGILALGFVAAFAAALLAVRFLLSYVKTHTFESFGYYRIILALIFLFAL